MGGGIDGITCRRYSLPRYRTWLPAPIRNLLQTRHGRVRSCLGCAQIIHLRNPTQFTAQKHPIHNRILPVRQGHGGHLNAALEITPNLEPLFGTRDENLRLMEDSLGVRIDLRSDAVHVEGPDEAVGRVQRIFQDFEALRRQGINPHNGELNGMLRLVVADPATTLRSLADSGKQRSAGVKRTVQPRSHQSAQVCRGHRAERHGLRRGTGRYRQDVSCRGHGGGGDECQEGEPHRAGASGGRGRRATGLSCPARCRRRSIPIFVRSTTRFTTCSIRRRSTRCWRRT